MIIFLFVIQRATRLNYFPADKLVNLKFYGILSTLTTLLTINN